MNILRRQNFRSYTSLIVSVERSKIDHSYRCASQKTDNGQRRPFCRSMVISGWIERAARDRPTSAISETARRLEIFCQGLFTFQTRGGQLRWEIILFFFCFFFFIILSFVRPRDEGLRRYFIEIWSRCTYAYDESMETCRFCSMYTSVRDYQNI